MILLNVLLSYLMCCRTSLSFNLLKYVFTEAY